MEARKEAAWESVEDTLTKLNWIWELSVMWCYVRLCQVLVYPKLTLEVIFTKSEIKRGTDGKSEF